MKNVPNDSVIDPQNRQHRRGEPDKQNASRLSTVGKIHIVVVTSHCIKPIHGDVILHTIENMMRSEHIEERNGGFCVNGTRVSLDSIVYSFKGGDSPDHVIDRSRVTMA
jgi:hypothetical protein